MSTDNPDDRRHAVNIQVFGIDAAAALELGNLVAEVAQRGHRGTSGKAVIDTVTESSESYHLIAAEIIRQASPQRPSWQDMRLDVRLPRKDVEIYRRRRSAGPFEGDEAAS